MGGYFTTYKCGIADGYMDVVFDVLYLFAAVYLMGRKPESIRKAMTFLVKVLFVFGAVEFLSAIYYAMFHTAHMNQAQQLFILILSAIFISDYSIARRVAPVFALWSSELLWISVLGSSGVFELFENGDAFRTICMVGGLFALAWFFRSFAVTQLYLGNVSYIVVIVILALCGGVSVGNFGRTIGFDAYYLLSSLLLLITLLVVYLMFYQMNQTYQRNMELTVQDQNYQANDVVMHITEKNNEEMHILRHELKNHDAYIRALLQQKKYEELEEYMREKDLSCIVHITPQITSGNRLTDLIVNQKIALAESRNIKLDCEASVPEELPFSEIEYTSLLSNLLDNAIEAATKAAPIPNGNLTGKGPQKLENPVQKRKVPDYPEKEVVIQLRIYHTPGYLFIHLENPFSSELSVEQIMSLKTTKDNPSFHGYGTKVIQRVAERYNGYVQYQVVQTKFVSDVMMAISRDIAVRK